MEDCLWNWILVLNNLFRIRGDLHWSMRSVPFWLDCRKDALILTTWIWRKSPYEMCPLWPCVFWSTFFECPRRCRKRWIMISSMEGFFMIVWWCLWFHWWPFIVVGPSWDSSAASWMFIIYSPLCKTSIHRSLGHLTLKHKTKTQ